eukprot:12883109-Prorocentrum_lima.AAC.1
MYEKKVGCVISVASASRNEVLRRHSVDRSGGVRYQQRQKSLVRKLHSNKRALALIQRLDLRTVKSFGGVQALGRVQDGE